MRNVAAAITIVLLLACTYGRQFSYEDTKKLTPGVSTRADAERIFGPPITVSQSTDGMTILGWTYTHGYAASHGSKVLLIAFRPDGAYDHASEHRTGSEVQAAK